VEEVERLCEVFFSGVSGEGKGTVHSTLADLASPQTTEQARAVLDLFARVIRVSSHQYALFYACSSAATLLRKYWSRIDHSNVERLWVELLELSRKIAAHKLFPHATVVQIFQLIATITKLIWEESWVVSSELVPRVANFLEIPDEHAAVMAMELLKLCVIQVQPDSGVYSCSQRRTCISFRNTALGSIVQFVLERLTLWKSSGANLAVRAALSLLQNCFEFDYGGSGSNTIEASLSAVCTASFVSL